MLRLSAVGVIVTSLCMVTSLNGVCLHKNPDDSTASHQNRSSRVVPQNVSFEAKGAVHGISDDGCEFSSQGWESSDGVGVSLRIKHCKSSANADRVFRQIAKEATKIFERSALTGKGGRRVGQRIVATFSGREPTQGPEAIIWTRGDEVYILESPSFGHALLFEKKWPNV